MRDASRDKQAADYLLEFASGCRQAEQRMILQLAAGQLSQDGLHVKVNELAMATAAIRYQAKSNQIELVWTGPANTASTMRGTEQVLLEVIDESQQELLVVVYAAFDIQNVVLAIDRALERGVAVTVVVESINPGTGKQKPNFMASFSQSIRTRTRILHWPLKTRDTDENGRPGCLHAKVAVADRRVLFITSANLTGSAMRENMEMGLRLENDQLGESVMEHFERMFDEGTLVAP